MYPLYEGKKGIVLIILNVQGIVYSLNYLDINTRYKEWFILLNSNSFLECILMEKINLQLTEILCLLKNSTNQLSKLISNT